MWFFMTDITKKHDKLARCLLTDLEVAKEFLNIHLPSEFRAKCDFSSLIIEDCSFVKSDLKSTKADVVYKINLHPATKVRKPEVAYIYTLVEHQSTADSLMPLRILGYQLNIIRRHLDLYHQDKLQLPLVVPIVFYNGERSPYPYPCDVAEMFADRELYEKVGLGKFGLVDLTVMDDNEIVQHGKVAALESTLKHIRDRDFLRSIAAIVNAIEASDKAGMKHESLNATFQYVMDAKEESDVELFFNKILNSELYKYKEDIMTYSEQLRQEGRQEGAHNTQQKIVNNMLHAGLKPEDVAKQTGIPLQVVEELSK